MSYHIILIDQKQKRDNADNANELAHSEIGDLRVTLLVTQRRMFLTPREKREFSCVTPSSCDLKAEHV